MNKVKQTFNNGFMKYDEATDGFILTPNKKAYQDYLNWNPEPTFKRYSDFVLIDHKNKEAIDVRTDERKRAKQLPGKPSPLHIF